jgi:hypothetical protein
VVKPRARWHWALPLLAMSLPARSAPTAAELMEQFDRLLWGRTLQGQFEMVITTPSWSRSLSMELWSQRPARSFVRVSAPARDDLQEAIRVLREHDFGIALQFGNYRG